MANMGKAAEEPSNSPSNLGTSEISLQKKGNLKGNSNSVLIETSGILPRHAAFQLPSKSEASKNYSDQNSEKSSFNDIKVKESEVSSSVLSNEQKSNTSSKLLRGSQSRVKNPLLRSVINMASSFKNLGQAASVGSNHDFEDNVEKRQSRNSLASSNASNDEVSGKLLIESALTKLHFMKYFFLALVFLPLVYYICREMTEGNGIPLSLGIENMVGTPAIILGLVLATSHFLCLKAFENAIIVVVAMFLARKQGVGCTIVGAAQGSLLDQISVFTKLSARCTVRSKFLIITLTKIIQNLLIILIPLIFVNIYSDKKILEGDPLSCIEYNQNGVQSDRGWPNLSVAMGVGEYAVATSLGIFRAEEDVQMTQFFSPPQLIDVADDGTRIFGSGYISYISTKCLCSFTEKANELVKVGVDATAAADMEYHIKQLGYQPGMANFIKSNDTSVDIQTAFTSTDTCGAKVNGNQPIAVCFTSIYDIRDAVIEVEYMTDGNPASIATKRTKLKSIGSNANITWLHNGYIYLMGGNFSHTFLPANSPNSLNSLLSWATDSAQQISATRISEGVEAMFAVLTKSAIQRSFNTEGKKCPQIIKDKSVQVALLHEGAIFNYLLFCGTHLIFTIFSGAVMVAWLNYKFPISPAIRFVNERSYFMILLTKHIFSKQLLTLRGIYSESDFWAKLDNTIRIGESRNTVDDLDQGIIVIAKPKMVVDLSWNKIYK